MRLFDSGFGRQLLVAASASGATLVLCILYVHTQGPRVPVFGVPLNIVSPADVTPLPQKSRTQAILPTNDLEPRFLKDSSVKKWTCAPDDSDAPVSGFLKNFECHLSSAVYFVFSGVPVFILAVVMDAVWHIVHGMKRHKLNPFVREISLGVIVLNLFYNEHFPVFVHENPFSLTCAILCLEAIIFRIIDKRNHDFSMETNPRTNDDLSDLEARDRYQLMSSSFTNIFFLFVCQLTLGLFYIYALNNRQGGWADSSGWRWFIGLLICNLAGEEEIGNSFSFPFWLKLVTTKNQTMQKRSRICYCCFVSYQSEAKPRMVMSMIVNMFIRRIIFCTAPVLLSVVDNPIDFIKDCLAVFFITKLDELDNAVNFEKDLQKKKRDDGNMTQFLFGEQESDPDGEEVLVTEETMEKTVAELNKKISSMEDRLTLLEQKP